MTNDEIKRCWIEAWEEQNTGVEPDEEEVEALKVFLAKAKPIIEKQERERITKEIENMFADNYGVTTFIRKRDGKAGVENCKLIIVGEWQALKGEK